MNSLSHRTNHISIIERAKIELLYNQGLAVSRIALGLDRAKSSISAELRLGIYRGKYTASIAQKRADARKLRSHRHSKADNPELLQQIERLIKRRWSPEIIAHELGGAISITTIYTITRTIRPEWRNYLAYQKKAPYHKGSAGKDKIPNRTDISERPADVRFGDYEADTVISSRGGKSCLGVFVERTTRLYKVVKMPDKSAKSMVRATMKALRGQYVRSITYDNGTENAKHCVTNWLLKCKSWFCRAYCSGDKGLVENRNKLLRQWLPKGTNFDLIGEEKIDRIEKAINERPMKCLEDGNGKWLSPLQSFNSATSFGLDL
jgi:IS30 family transposase